MSSLRADGDCFDHNRSPSGAGGKACACGRLSFRCRFAHAAIPRLECRFDAPIGLWRRRSIQTRGGPWSGSVHCSLRMRRSRMIRSAKFTTRPARSQEPLKKSLLTGLEGAPSATAAGTCPRRRRQTSPSSSPCARLTRATRLGLRRGCAAEALRACRR